MSSNKFSPKLLIGILLLVFFAASLIIRIVFSYGQIFEGPWVKFTSNDAYFFMRMVDSAVHNFPHYTSFDPYYIFPGGKLITHVSFFYQFLAGIIWLVGMGHPSQHLIDIIGAYSSPVLAALTVIPVYFIGKTLFNRWAGILAAALMAILPGEFLGRTILGFTDTPAIETFLTATWLAFLLPALKTSAGRELRLAHFLKREWPVVLRPLVYSLLAGFFLGIYMVTWNGGLLFVFTFTLYLVVQFIIDHLRGKPTEYLGITAFFMFLIADIIFLPVSEERFVSVAMVVALFIPPVMAGVSRFVRGRGWKPAYYPLAMLGIGIVFIGIFAAVSSHLLGLMFSAFRIFAPVGSSATTTMEMQPFLYPQGSFTTAVAWGNFTTSFFLVPWWPIPGVAFISFVILVYLFIRRRSDDKAQLLFFFWNLVILVLTLMQRRFAYYFVVNIALLSAYLSYEIIWLSGLRRLAERPGKTPEDAPGKKDKKAKPKAGIGIYHVNAGLAIIVVFLVVLLPNVVKAKAVASVALFAPSDNWQEALVWMQGNTPEPLGDPDNYYRLYDKGYTYPATAYGVTSWWDYGYWVTRIARRIPSANPSQDPEPITNIANLFLSTDNRQADEMMKGLGSSYIIADTSLVSPKYWAVVTWAGKRLEDYIGTYYVQQQASVIQVQVFYPEYYRSLLVRLYNFNGKSVTDVKPAVIGFTVTKDRAGKTIRLINDYQQFDDYQKALDFLQQKGTADHAIIGTNPFTSPIPLEAVPGYQLVFSSKGGINSQDVGLIPEVKIFQYTAP